MILLNCRQYSVFICCWKNRYVLLNSLVFKFPRCHCKFLKKKKNSFNPIFFSGSNASPRSLGEIKRCIANNISVIGEIK